MSHRHATLDPFSIALFRVVFSRYGVVFYHGKAALEFFAWHSTFPTRRSTIFLHGQVFWGPSGTSEQYVKRKYGLTPQNLDKDCTMKPAKGHHHVDPDIFGCSIQEVCALKTEQISLCFSSRKRVSTSWAVRKFVDVWNF